MTIFLASIRDVGKAEAAIREHDVVAMDSIAGLWEGEPGSGKVAYVELFVRHSGPLIWIFTIVLLSCA